MKPHLWFIRVISRIVPLRFRSDWKQEWEAELQHRESLLQQWRSVDWKARRDLLRRSAGAFFDALAMQPRRLEEETFQDLRYGTRVLLKERAFTAIAVAVLALGIGLTTTVFSLVNAVLLRPLPYEQPDRLVRVFETHPVREVGLVPLSPLNFQDWKLQNRVFEGMAVYRGEPITLAAPDGPEQISGMRVSADFFPTLGVSAARGRLFLADDDEPSSGRVAVLSHSAWMTRFGGDAGIVGRPLTLGGRAFSVIGVLPADFSFGAVETEIWTPMRLGDETHRMDRTERYLHSIARLRAGTTIDDARKDLSAIADSLADQFPPPVRPNGASVLALQEDLVGKGLRASLPMLLGAVGFVMLIACSNFANLLLARSATRKREIAIRFALGAGRIRIIRQCLTESVLLAMLGAAIGSLLAYWSMSAAVSLLEASSFRFGALRLKAAGLDPAVIAFCIGISVLTGLIAGLFPALQSTSQKTSVALKEGSRSLTAGFGQLRLRSVLVVAQISLSLVLLVGAGLLINSFWRVLHVDIGFDAGRILTMQLQASPEEAGVFFPRLVEEVTKVPGVESASVVSSLPLMGIDLGANIFIENRDPETGHQAHFRVVGNHYFKTMGASLLQGRDFSEQDSANAEPVVIVNEAMARQLWDESPIGRRIRRGGKNRPWEVIVGVVENAKVFGPDSDPRAEAYVPHSQFLIIPNSPIRIPNMALVVRAAGDPLALVNPVRNRIRELDRNKLVTNVRTMEQVLSRSVAPRRLNVALSGVFAGAALLLTAVAIYGLVSYSVAQRTREIGVRIALGAGRGAVLKLVAGQGSRLAFAGIVIGLAGGIVAGQWMSSLLFGITAADPATLAAVALLQFGVVLLACYIPARRATRVDPLIALRHE